MPSYFKNVIRGDEIYSQSIKLVETRNERLNVMMLDGGCSLKARAGARSCP